MKAERERFAFGVAVLVLLSGYVIVVRPMESSIGGLSSDLVSVRFAIGRDAAAARAIPALTARRDRLTTRLAHYHLRDSHAATVDRFLHAAANVSIRRRVSIQSVVTDVAQQVRPAHPPSAEAPTGDDLRLDLSVRGAYDDVLKAARDLNEIDLATQISVVALGNPDRRPGTRPQLSATFHVVLLRESDATANRSSNPV
jgi:hypothetical protein